MQILVSLAPDLLIIALGISIGSLFSPFAWQSIDKLSYYLFYPALLFVAASQRAIPLDTLWLYGSLACVIVTTGFALSLFTQRILGISLSVDIAGIMQNAWRFNTALGFVAIGTLLHLSPTVASLFAVVVGIAIPLANVFAIILLTKNQTLSVLLVAKEIALNPFLLSSFAGIFLALSEFNLPSVVNLAIEKIAVSAIPILLLSLGAALRSSPLWPPQQFPMFLHAIKLVMLPGIVYLTAQLFDLSGELPATLLIFAALPTASVAHILATHYGADRSGVALVVMQSTAISLITLPFWTGLAVGFF